MKEAPSCEQCGQVFPNQLHLHKCAGSAESIKHDAKPAPPVIPRKAPAKPIAIKADITEAATEDLPRCEKCGQTFPWNKLHLRWKHKCEPLDQPRKRSKSTGPEFESRRPVSSAATEELSCSVNEQYFRSKDGIAPQVCRCGEMFEHRKEFITHVLTCSKSNPMYPSIHWGRRTCTPSNFALVMTIAHGLVG